MHRGTVYSEDHVVGDDQEDDHRGKFGGLADGSGETRRGAESELLRRLGIPVQGGQEPRGEKQEGILNPEDYTDYSYWRL